MDFVKLFEEDANLNQGEFVTLLSEQHWVEIRAYAQEVSDAIDGAERVEPGSNLAPLAAVRGGFAEARPHQEPRGRRRRVRARRAVCHLQQRRDAVRTRRRRGRGHVQDQAALQAGEARGQLRPQGAAEVPRAAGLQAGGTQPRRRRERNEHSGPVYALDVTTCIKAGGCSPGGGVRA